MSRDGLLKPLGISAAAALVIYAIAYNGIEHRRSRNGPWTVTFTTDHSGSPALLINQDRVGVTNVLIAFVGNAQTTNAPVTIEFRDPRPVPFDVPYGQCRFMDTTFLPGTVVFELFGHEIQLLPRVLTIDKREHSWQSNSELIVSGG